MHNVLDQSFRGLVGRDSSIADFFGLWKIEFDPEVGTKAIEDNSSWSVLQQSVVGDDSLN